MYESCENCRHLGEIYYPPTRTEDARHEHACFYFSSSDREVMYLDTLDGLCEVYSERKEDDRT